MKVTQNKMKTSWLLVVLLGIMVGSLEGQQDEEQKGRLLSNENTATLSAAAVGLGLGVVGSLLVGKVIEDAGCKDDPLGLIPDLLGKKKCKQVGFGKHYGQQYPSHQQQPHSHQYPNHQQYPSIQQYPSQQQYPHHQHYPSKQQHPSHQQYPSHQQNPEKHHPSPTQQYHPQPQSNYFVPTTNEQYTPTPQYTPTNTQYIPQEPHRFTQTVTRKPTVSNHVEQDAFVISADPQYQPQNQYHNHISELGSSSNVHHSSIQGSEFYTQDPNPAIQPRDLPSLSPTNLFTPVHNQGVKFPESGRQGKSIGKENAANENLFTQTSSHVAKPDPPTKPTESFGAPSGHRQSKALEQLSTFSQTNTHKSKPDSPKIVSHGFRESKAIEHVGTFTQTNTHKAKPDAPKVASQGSRQSKAIEHFGTFSQTNTHKAKPDAPKIISQGSRQSKAIEHVGTFSQTNTHKAKPDAPKIISQGSRQSKSIEPVGTFSQTNTHKARPDASKIVSPNSRESKGFNSFTQTNTHKAKPDPPAGVTTSFGSPQETNSHFSSEKLTQFTHTNRESKSIGENTLFTQTSAHKAQPDPANDEGRQGRQSKSLVRIEDDALVISQNHQNQRQANLFAPVATGADAPTPTVVQQNNPGRQGKSVKPVDLFSPVSPGEQAPTPHFK